MNEPPDRDDPPARDQRRATGRSGREHRKAERRRPKREWKSTNGSLTFFNRNPELGYKPVIGDVPLVAETLRDAFLSGDNDPAATQRSKVAGLLSGIGDQLGGLFSRSGGSPPPSVRSRAVYRGDGSLIPEYLEQNRLAQTRFPERIKSPTVTLAHMKAAPVIEKPCIYLGDLRDHFGHFLLESLARAWCLEQADAATALLFHGSTEPERLGSFAHDIFRALGGSLSRIKVVRADLRVGHLIVPKSQYWAGLKASPGMCVVFDRIRETMARGRTNRGATPTRVYFTRRNLASEPEPPWHRRPILNEDEAEAVFRKRGFEILAPESLPFEDQVAIAANATHIAGASGSALHLVLFNGNPRTRLIELRTKHAVNQLMINTIRGVQGFHIWCVKGPVSPLHKVLDIDAVERALEEIDQIAP